MPLPTLHVTKYMKKVLYISVATFLATSLHQLYLGYIPSEAFGGKTYYDYIPAASSVSDFVWYSTLLWLVSIVGIAISTIFILIKKSKKENHGS